MTQRGKNISWAVLTVVISAATTAALLTLTQTTNVTIINNPTPTPVREAAPAGAEDGPPPAFVPGVPADFREKAREAYEAYPKPFRVADSKATDDLRRKTTYLWHAVLQIETPRKPRGQHYRAGPQEIGDCVAFGGATAIFYSGANAVVAGTAGSIDDPYESFLYGLTRVTIGRNRPPCRSDGAYPDDLANGFKSHGWITYAEAGKPYSGSVSKQLGCNGPSRELLTLAKARAGGDCYPIRHLDELLEAIHNGYAGTAAFDWSPGREVTEDGRIVTLFNGTNRGGHQVAFVGWDGERQQCVFHNSHGTNAHTANEGDPPGSFRVSRKTLEWMLRTGTFWAFSSIAGFPAQELDLSPLLPKPRREAKAFSHVPFPMSISAGPHRCVGLPAKPRRQVRLVQGSKA